ncbi:MAG TPA: pseudouridine synthase [Bdellovibrionota bacterium]|jgi:pseudouridine synthase
MPISRQKLLDVSRLDKKATLRAQRYKARGGVKLPKLREGKVSVPAAKAADGKERLQKIIATAGICSRRKAEELILLGQVTVNGEVVNTLGAKADPVNDIIAVDGQVIDIGAHEKQYFLLNKPRGYITSTSDPQGRPTVMDLMGGVDTRIYPVGRLDYASEGLLLLTNDGDMAHRLMHPSSQVRRAYAVKIKGEVTDEHLRTIRHGVQLSDGFVKPVRVTRGDRLQNKEWIEITVTEGKNLEIRRIFAVVGLDVERLRRIAIGPLRIEVVPVGKFVRLTKRQVDEIFEID